MSSDLQTLAHRLSVPAELQASWNLVVRGIERHMLTPEDLPDLLHELQAGRDYVLDELGFELLDGQMRISFLDEKIFVDAESLIALLQSLREHQAAEVAQS